MGRSFICTNPYKVNGKCVCKGKSQEKCLIYELKFMLCGTIYIFNQKKEKENWLSFLWCPNILNNGQKSDLFSAQYEKHFKYTMSITDPHKCMTLKAVKIINL